MAWIQAQFQTLGAQLTTLSNNLNGLTNTVADFRADFNRGSVDSSYVRAHFYNQLIRTGDEPLTWPLKLLQGQQIIAVRLEDFLATHNVPLPQTSNILK